MLPVLYSFLIYYQDVFEAGLKPLLAEMKTNEHISVFLIPYLIFLLLLLINLVCEIDGESRAFLIETKDNLSSSNPKRLSREYGADYSDSYEDRADIAPKTTFLQEGAINTPSDKDVIETLWSSKTFWTMTKPTIWNTKTLVRTIKPTVWTTTTTIWTTKPTLLTPKSTVWTTKNTLWATKSKVLTTFQAASTTTTSTNVTATTTTTTMYTMTSTPPSIWTSKSKSWTTQNKLILASSPKPKLWQLNMFPKPLGEPKKLFKELKKFWSH